MPATFYSPPAGLGASHETFSYAHHCEQRKTSRLERREKPSLIRRLFGSLMRSSNTKKRVRPGDEADSTHPPYSEKGAWFTREVIYEDEHADISMPDEDTAKATNSIHGGTLSPHPEPNPQILRALLPPSTLPTQLRVPPDGKTLWETPVTSHHAAAPAPFLAVLHIYPLNIHAFAPKHLPLHPGKRITLGRPTLSSETPASDNGFLDAPGVNPKQSEVWYDGDRVWIKDVGGGEGTYIGKDMPVLWGGEAQLLTLDVIGIGCPGRSGVMDLKEEQRAPMKKTLARGIVARVYIVLNSEDHEEWQRLDAIWERVAGFENRRRLAEVTAAPPPPTPVRRALPTSPKARCLGTGANAGRPCGATPLLGTQRCPTCAMVMRLRELDASRTKKRRRDDEREGREPKRARTSSAATNFPPSGPKRPKVPELSHSCIVPGAWPCTSSTFNVPPPSSPAPLTEDNVEDIIYLGSFPPRQASASRSTPQKALYISSARPDLPWPYSAVVPPYSYDAFDSQAFSTRRGLLERAAEREASLRRRCRAGSPLCRNTEMEGAPECVLHAMKKRKRERDELIDALDAIGAPASAKRACLEHERAREDFDAVVTLAERARVDATARRYMEPLPAQLTLGLIPGMARQRPARLIRFPPIPERTWDGAKWAGERSAVAHLHMRRAALIRGMSPHAWKSAKYLRYRAWRARGELPTSVQKAWWLHRSQLGYETMMRMQAEDERMRGFPYGKVDERVPWDEAEPSRTFENPTTDEEGGVFHAVWQWWAS